MPKTASSRNAGEIGRFSKLAKDWWDENGPMQPLHRMRAPRLNYLSSMAAKELGKSLKGLNILDLGCGAGLMSEALAEAGAIVLGVDASEELIAAARAHGAGIKNLSYRCATVEELSLEKNRFDIVMALEVIEHVDGPETFVKNAAALVDKKGLLVFSTLNRTPHSFATAIVGAEYILRVIPRGTHDWKKFIKPSELSAMVKAQGMAVRDITGLQLNPLSRRFSLNSGDVSVDYFLTATR